MRRYTVPPEPQRDVAYVKAEVVHHPCGPAKAGLTLPIDLLGRVEVTRMAECVRRLDYRPSDADFMASNTACAPG